MTIVSIRLVDPVLLKLGGSEGFKNGGCSNYKRDIDMCCLRPRRIRIRRKEPSLLSARAAQSDNTVSRPPSLTGSNTLSKIFVNSLQNLCKLEETLQLWHSHLSSSKAKLVENLYTLFQNSSNLLDSVENELATLLKVPKSPPRLPRHMQETGRTDAIARPKEGKVANEHDTKVASATATTATNTTTSNNQQDPQDRGLMGLTGEWEAIPISQWTREPWAQWDPNTAGMAFPILPTRDCY